MFSVSRKDTGSASPSNSFREEQVGSGAEIPLYWSLLVCTDATVGSSSWRDEMHVTTSHVLKNREVSKEKALTVSSIYRHGLKPESSQLLIKIETFSQEMKMLYLA